MSGGLYVHYPYCEHRCTYCDFALTTPRKAPAERFTSALISELALRAPASPGPYRTFYVGGGTPSLWPVPALARFLAHVRAGEGLAADAEVTLEANPEQVTDAWLEGVVALGVNRISLGVQALDEAHLAQLERRHGRAGAEAALDRLARAHARGALASFSVDLIYGLAGQTVPAWQAALDSLAQRWSPPHLSLYMLTIEPRTVLARGIRDGRAPQPDDGLQIDMLFAARDRLATHGYTHYEVSSWARPGHIARHNAAYWDMRPYLGLGAGAHGFWGGTRWRNEARPSVYLSRVEAGEEPSAEREHPDAATLAFERVMTGLRRLDIGLALGPDEARFADAVAAELARGRLERVADRIRLTASGLQMMDDVLLSFA